MATYTSYDYTISQNSPQRRGVVMVLALASAVVLSPLYVSRRQKDSRYETMWNSGLVLPMVLAGLIIAIKTTSSSSSSSSMEEREGGSRGPPEGNSSWVLRIGSSSWGLASILVMLLFVLSCQDSVKHFFWR